MQSRSQLYPTFTAVVVVAGGLLAAVLAMFDAPAGAQRVDPASVLQCSGDRIIATHVTNDNVTKETRTPEQLADAWATVMKVERNSFKPAARINAFAAEKDRDIVFEDAADRVIAVLSYERDAKLGWRLESAVECA